MIGWSNGDVSIVDLSAGSEVWYMHGHVHAINAMLICDDNECLVTIAADNYLKLWDVDRSVS